MISYLRIRKIKKLYFGYTEIAKALRIKPGSARVTANRYVKNSVLIRIKRNLYLLREKWENLGIEDRFILANIIQVPSYISLMTAMSYYGITTQIQQDFIESIATTRTKEIKIDEMSFNYTKIKRGLYFSFYRQKGIFIATPEKAFLDALYLMSINRYKFDLTSLDLSKIDKPKLRRLAKKFPIKTRRLVEGYGYFKKT